LILLRHVLEHVETPREFVAHLREFLRAQGQLWIEVPDLESTVRGRRWSNFYQLHCSYFSQPTLDALLGEAGCFCFEGEVVDVFGGSLLRRFAFGRPKPKAELPRWGTLAAQVDEFKRNLNHLTARMPDPCVGYGAGERTAVTLGFCPVVERKLKGLYDSNPRLDGRFLAGTQVPIAHKEQLFRQPPAAILLFALSHQEEILAELKARLPTDVLIGIVDHESVCQPLAAFS
jgi:hypothetical protein